MSSFNKVLIMGRLTRDPETRTTPTGLQICKLGIATSRKYKPANSEEMKEETTFVDVDAFGRQAEVISKYFSKGKPIFIEGRLKFDQWETNTGEKRSKLGVTLESFQFVGGRDEGFSGGGSSYEASAPPARQPEPAAAGGGSLDVDEDVPF